MVEKTTQIGFRNRLIESISERYGMPFAEVKRVVETTLDTIVDTLVTEGRVELRDFGVFEVVERKGRTAINLSNMTKVQVPSRKVVKFKQGKAMKERITKPSMKRT